MRIFEVFFYLTILLLPTQLGFHFWPDWSLVLGRRVDYLAPTLYLTDITIFLTLFTWFLQQHEIKNTIKKVMHYKIPFFVALSIIVLNTVFSSNPTISIIKWGKIIEYGLFFYFIYTAKPSLRKTMYCFSFAVFYSSVIAIAQFVLQHTVGGIFWFLGERTFTTDTPGIAKINWCWFSRSNCGELLRPYATFPHPNILGGFLLSTIPLLIYILRKEKNKLIRIFCIAGSTLGISTIGITFSRSVWIIGGIGICGFFLSRVSKRTWIKQFIGVLSIIGLFLLAWPYISSLTTANESVFIRLDLAKAALQLFLSHLFLGAGLGTFLPNLPHLINIRDLYFLQPVHNIYLLLASETGVFGIAFTIMGISFYMNAYRQKPRLTLLVLPIIIIGILGIIDHYPFTVQQGQLLTTCLLALPFLKTNS